MRLIATTLFAINLLISIIHLPQRISHMITLLTFVLIYRHELFPFR